RHGGGEHVMAQDPDQSPQRQPAVAGVAQGRVGIVPRRRGGIIQRGRRRGLGFDLRLGGRGGGGALLLGQLVGAYRIVRVGQARRSYRPPRAASARVRASTKKNS